MFVGCGMSPFSSSTALMSGVGSRLAAAGGLLSSSTLAIDLVILQVLDVEMSGAALQSCKSTSALIKPYLETKEKY